MPRLASLVLIFCATLLLCAAAPPRSPEAEKSYRTATSLVEQGLPQAAIEHLQAALRAAPRDMQVHRDYQDLMKAQGFGSEVTQEYKARRDKEPSDADWRYLYGRASGDPAIARVEFEAALKSAPQHSFAMQGMGGVAAVEGKLDEALSWYRKALAVDAQSAEIHNKVANVQLAKGDEEAAISAWRLAISAEPTDYHAYLNLGAVLSTRGDLSGAADLLKQAVDRAPGNPLAHSNYAYILFKLQRIDESLSHFAAALAVNPRDRMVQGSRDLVQQVKDGKIPFAAFAPYEKALQAQMQDPAKAVQHYKEVLLLAPNFAVAHMNLGLAQAASGSVDEARKSLEKATELAPRDAAAWYNLGYLQLGMDQLDAARKSLGKAVELDPQDVDALAAMALAELGSGRTTESLRRYKQALDISPRDPGLWLQQAGAQAQSGDLKGAETSSRRALQIAPGLLAARVQLVAILREDRRYDEALAELQHLESAAPGHPDLAAERASLEAARSAAKAQASAPGTVHLARIYTKDRARADEAWKKLQAGGTFDALARDYGEGPEKARSGDIGFVDPAQLKAEVAAAVRALQPGQVTAVLDLGNGGWAILRRTP
jgi:tetratricopeptide (TPR) repeat protein